MRMAVLTPNLLAGDRVGSGNEHTFYCAVKVWNSNFASITLCCPQMTRS